MYKYLLIVIRKKNSAICNTSLNPTINMKIYCIIYNSNILNTNLVR